MLQKKNIIITGTTSGIGRSIATLCAREGANVGLNYFQNETAAFELAKQLEKEHNICAFPLKFDIKDSAAITQGYKTFLAKFPTLDGWVNNAGINRQGLLPTQTDEMIQEQIQTNLVGTILCSRTIIPQLLKQRHGVIINIGSIASSHVVQGQSVYAATKGAIVSFTKALAVEYGRKKIRVNCVEPGPIQTKMLQGTQALAEERILDKIPLKRLGTPNEIAELVVFLLSDKASFLTGGIFTADGGYSTG